MIEKILKQETATALKSKRTDKQQKTSVITVIECKNTWRKMVKSSKKLLKHNFKISPSNHFAFFFWNCFENFRFQLLVTGQI